MFYIFLSVTWFQQERSEIEIDFTLTNLLIYFFVSVCIPHFWKTKGFYMYKRILNVYFIFENSVLSFCESSYK